MSEEEPEYMRGGSARIDIKLVIDRPLHEMRYTVHLRQERVLQFSPQSGPPIMHTLRTVYLQNNRLLALPAEPTLEMHRRRAVKNLERHLQFAQKSQAWNVSYTWEII